MRVVLATLFAELWYRETSNPQRQRVITGETIQPNRIFPICSGCVPRELIVAPGIGFDLTSTYGHVLHISMLSYKFSSMLHSADMNLSTFAIRYFNGTIIDIGRVSDIRITRNVSFQLKL